MEIGGAPMVDSSMKRVMIVDALNAYFRAFIVNPSLSVHGQPIGGLKGFLGILQKLCRDIKPDTVMIIWDGPGGSRKRREQNKNYKEGRKPIRVNRQTDLTDEQQRTNMAWQQLRLMEYLNELPVVQLRFDEVEADDVIAYATQLEHLKGWEKVIVSSDKDFLQLCNDETVLFRPIQKKVHNKLNIVEDFDIHPRNFALARAIAGDPSDNLKGVPRAGLKSISKNFNFLREDKDITLQEIFDCCLQTESKAKFFTNVLEYRDVIIENYKLMQLYAPALSLQCRDKVHFALENFEYDYNKTEIIRMMNQDGFGVFNWDDLHATMNRICLDKALKN
jgi:5'-3' exonuclease